MKRHFFIDFGKDETNICEMTKKGQKMSFHAGKVEIAAKKGIMEIVIDFTERKKKILLIKRRRYYEKGRIKKDVCVVCACVCRYAVDWLFRYGSRTLGEYTDGKQHRDDTGERGRGRIRNKPYQREAVRYAGN